MPALLAIALLLAPPGRAVVVAPAAIIETARGYLGVPYRLGGDSRDGVDCSGLVLAIFRAHGIELPRTSAEQAAVGRHVRWRDVRPGDLLFFTNEPGRRTVQHVGVAVDPTHMLHASTGRAQVVIDPIDMQYYRERRLVARRVLPPVARKATKHTGRRAGEPAAGRESPRAESAHLRRAQ